MKKLLFTLALFELFVGGGGRLTEIGPITLRMLLYGVCLALWFVTSLGQGAQNYSGQKLAFGFLIFYLFIHLNALFVGALQGEDLFVMLADMQQSLYWLLAPFFAFMLTSIKMIFRVADLIRGAGVVLAVPYLAVIVASFLGFFDLMSVYSLLSSSREFFFRGESFLFYKGFLYLGVAIVFFAAMRERYWLLLAGVVMSAMVLTLTRGFILATSVSLLCLFLHQRKWGNLLCMALVVLIALYLVLVYLPGLDEIIVSKRVDSNSERVDDFMYVAGNLTPMIVLVGDGFGSMINSRVGTENTFLWAFWRFGVVGLVFWFCPLIFATIYFLSINRASDVYRLACAFYFGMILVYVQTATNPYLNNPIGLSYVILALFSVRRLSRICSISVSCRPSPAGSTL